MVSIKTKREDKIVFDTITSCEAHIKKYGYRKMSIKELDALCGLE